MFQISGVSVPNGNAVTIFGGPPNDRKPRSIGESLAGGVYTVTVPGMGALTLEDVGWTSQQAWGVRLNHSPDSVWLYQGEGQAGIAIDASGQVSINGTDMHTGLLPQHTNDEYLAAARRFAPVVTFYHDGDAGSEERYWPCSIDFLLEHSTLRRGRHGYSGYNTNGGTPPGVAWFQDRCHVFFQDHGGNGVMHIVSPDGLSGWSRPASWYTGSNTSAGPSAVAFNGKLHLFFRDQTGNGIFHVSSATGDDWGGFGYLGLDCDGQPEVIATPDCLYLVAVDAGGNGIMYAKSTDGENFSHDYTGYNTNGGTPPTVAWFGDQFHVFFQDHGGNGLMHITNPTGEGRGWSRPASWYLGVNTSAAPAAVATGGKLHVFYRDPNGNGIFHRDCTNGNDWGPAVYIGLDCDGQPQVTAHDDDVFLTCVDAGGNGIMVGVIDTLAIQHPTQDDLVAHADSLSYLDVEPDAYGGQLSEGQVTAPMYVSVQAFPDHVDLTYTMLYAFQGGQPCRADRKGSEFNCIVENFAMHQGDLEWVTVRLDPALTRIEQVGYACHGDIDGGGGWWPTIPDPTRGGATYLREGEHPMVRVARNGHSCRNGWNQSAIFVQDQGGQDGAVRIIDLFSNLDPTPACPAWRPFEPGHPGGLVPLGLTLDGRSINEPWALFGGRLGRQQHNDFESATYIDGSHLDTADWVFVKAVDWLAEALDKIPAAVRDEVFEGIGPEGPKNRDFVGNSALTVMQEIPLRQAVPQQASAPETATAQPSSA